MEIIYFTTSATTKDYETILEYSKKFVNPSNQNFHHSLIRAFASNFKVTIVSSSLINSDDMIFKSDKKSSSSEDYLVYHYLNSHGKNIVKYLSIKKSLHKFLANYFKNVNDKVLFVVDAMNMTLSKLVSKYQKKYNVKSLGIVTDNPSLITSIPKNKVDSYIKQMRKFDYYIFLNEKLNSLINIHKKPYTIINGIYNHQYTKSIKHYSNYFFFAGALYEKYGIKNLIHAFYQIDKDVNLLIAGDGPEKEYVVTKAIKNRNIFYLGTLSKNYIHEYENNAIANINPRPLTSEMDAYCIPSKVIEYASCKSLTISTHHSLLKNVFGNSIYWTKGDDVDSLFNAMEDVLKLSDEEKTKMTKAANKIAKKNFSLVAISEQLLEFINKTMLQ